MAKTNHQKKPVQATMPQPLDREEKNLKIKELIKLAKEQGYLTYGDVNDILPENISSPPRNWTRS
jgi:RNA polymerase primary sigma factor